MKNKLSVEQRNAQWAKGDFISLAGKPLSGYSRKAAQRYYWAINYPERAADPLWLAERWMEGEYVDKWGEALTGIARANVERYAEKLRAERTTHAAKLLPFRKKQA